MELELKKLHPTLPLSSQSGMRENLSGMGQDLRCCPPFPPLQHPPTHRLFTLPKDQLQRPPHLHSLWLTVLQKLLQIYPVQNVLQVLFVKKCHFTLYVNVLICRREIRPELRIYSIHSVWACCAQRHTVSSVLMWSILSSWFHVLPPLPTKLSPA